MGSRPGCAIPKAIKMVLVYSSLADARNKRAVPGRYKKAGRYPLFVMSKYKLYRAYVVCFKRDVK